MTLYELWDVCDALINVEDDCGHKKGYYGGEAWGKKKQVGLICAEDQNTILVIVDA